MATPGVLAACVSVDPTIGEREPGVGRIPRARRRRATPLPQPRNRNTRPGIRTRRSRLIPASRRPPIRPRPCLPTRTPPSPDPGTSRTPPTRPRRPARTPTSRTVRTRTEPPGRTRTSHPGVPGRAAVCLPAGAPGATYPPPSPYGPPAPYGPGAPYPAYPYEPDGAYSVPPPRAYPYEPEPAPARYEPESLNPPGVPHRAGDQPSLRAGPLPAGSLPAWSLCAGSWSPVRRRPVSAPAERPARAARAARTRTRRRCRNCRRAARAACPVRAGGGAR